MRKCSISIILIALITIGMIIPTVCATNNQIVITYGETCYSNNDYKNIVDSYFTSQVSKFHQATIKIITADDVNKISTSISKKVYTSNQIFSSALVDLTSNEDITVDVDESKITTINPSMYKSALSSAGITKGHVVVTSPVTATGESALSGVMSCYEDATNTVIPDEVKEAANDEIQTESNIVKSSNVNPNDLSNIVDTVKEEVNNQNITDENQIAQIIEDVSQNNNVNLTDENIEELSETIKEVQDVQGIAAEYKNKFSDVVNNNGGSILDQILKPIFSFLGFN